jgi:hypothetical protein
MTDEGSGKGGRAGALWQFFFGRQLSMAMSILTAVGVWYFFMQMRGWTPPEGQEADYSTYVHWFLLGYLAIQLIILIPASTEGSPFFAWLDTFTSLLPLLVVLYVLMLHWSNLERLPIEQLRYAKSTLGVMTLDFIVDFWVAVATQSHARLAR